MRSDRRHHRERLKRNRRFHWGRDLAGEPRPLGMAVGTPCTCSCWSCGNPRRLHGERSIQERSDAGLLRRLVAG